MDVFYILPILDQSLLDMKPRWCYIPPWEKKNSADGERLPHMVFYSSKESQSNWSKKPPKPKLNPICLQQNLADHDPLDWRQLQLPHGRRAPTNHKCHRLAPCHYFFVLPARRVFGPKPTTVAICIASEGIFFWYHQVGFGTLASVSLNTTMVVWYGVGGVVSAEEIGGVDGTWNWNAVDTEEPRQWVLLRWRRLKRQTPPSKG